MTHFVVLRESKGDSAMLAMLCFLAATEKLTAILNTIVVERDWVAIVAGDDETRLRTLNSQMRRIDLFCKLVGPLAISFIDVASSQTAILATGTMTLLSMPVEYFAINRVFFSVPALQTTVHAEAQRSTSPTTM